MKLLLENWRRFLNEGKKVKIFRAQPASTKVIRNNDYVTMSRKFARDHAVTSAIYNDEPFFVVVAFVEEDKIKEADNPGEYRYTGDGIQAMPLDRVDAEGNIGSAAKHRVNEDVKVWVLGYIKPDSAFHTLAEWEEFAREMLRLQKEGNTIRTRGGEIRGTPEFEALINKFFSFQLDTDVDRYDLLTRKNVLDFIEDFVNHRFWGLKREYESYFSDIDKLRFAYFYSRGDLEPYVLIDDEFTEQVYGSLDNVVELKHYTTEAGVERIQNAITNGNPYDISSYTVMTQPFFRTTSDKVMIFKGNVRAAFRSDVKSYATDTGRRAVNMYRLEYPDKEENLCLDLETLCADDRDTSLWNEIIATPVEILRIEEK